MGTPGSCRVAFVVTHRIGMDRGVLLFVSVCLQPQETDLSEYGQLPPETP